MAQLLVKKSSWWEFNTKQALIWFPVAAVQASTLAGLGYFYHRLNVLETQPVRQPVLANALQDVKAPSTRLNRVPPPLPPAPAPASWQVAMDSPVALGFMRVGQDFSHVAPIKPKPKAVAVRSAVLHDADRADIKRVAQANRSASPVKLKKIAQQQLAPAVPESEPVYVPEVVNAEPLPVAIPAEITRGKPLPVGIVAWVYLGELRDYGWYGQRLHISPDSGLPEVGGEYRTQKIHGIYDQPHGNRTMGGFQQGDVVSILDVQHESNHGVWAKVRKIRAVGH
ncbi:hypothetical protein RCF98_13365 [Thiothrix lacustris]|uniref:SH3b domain-containing protein n=1 Tax=Thiothrix lacustris TaxID=525917 RepID=A0ABY9MMS4_9GAMM|nr:hypothetical protein [Thiothrix lacustris]WML89954.1 hypothetical protein RCF98_13365 [Thiothrix lacustris]